MHGVGQGRVEGDKVRSRPGGRFSKTLEGLEVWILVCGY